MGRWVLGLRRGVAGATTCIHRAWEAFGGGVRGSGVGGSCFVNWLLRM